jgi:hypothetical protein
VGGDQLEGEVLLPPHNIQRGVPRILWHYTVGLRLDHIVADGQIRQATIGVPHSEKPCVWFTASDAWEETANKLLPLEHMGEPVMLALDRDLTHRINGGLVRIGVAPDTAPHDWQAFKRLSGIPPKNASSLYQVAVEVGSRLSNWFVSFEPVPQSKWLCIQYWDGQKWHDDPAVRPRITTEEEVNRLLRDWLQTNHARLFRRNSVFRRSSGDVFSRA